MQHHVIRDMLRNRRMAEKNEEGVHQRLSFLRTQNEVRRKNSLSGCSQPQIQYKIFQDGDILINQGELVTESRKIYMIAEGKVGIFLDGVEVATRENTYVGESSVVGSLRSATVKAKGVVLATEMDVAVSNSFYRPVFPLMVLMARFVPRRLRRTKSLSS